MRTYLTFFLFHLFWNTCIPWYGYGRWTEKQEGREYVCYRDAPHLKIDVKKICSWVWQILRLCVFLSSGDVYCVCLGISCLLLAQTTRTISISYPFPHSITLPSECHIDGILKHATHLFVHPDLGALVQVVEGADIKQYTYDICVRSKTLSKASHIFRNAKFF